MQKLGEFAIQGLSAATLVKQFGSPLYVYDEDIIKRQCTKMIDAMKDNFPNYQILYACKANSNLSFIQAVKKAGVQGIDACSPFEVEYALQVGYTRDEINYTENFISDEDLQYAINNKIHITVAEYETLIKLPKYGSPKISLRLNLGIGAGHHSYVVTGGENCKFGIFYSMYKEQIKEYKEYIIGLHQHIGSKVDVEEYLKAVEKLFQVAQELNLPHLQYLNLGGGFSIPYKKDEKEVDLQNLFSRVAEIYKKYFPAMPHKIIFEPGRFLSAQSGSLLCTVTSTLSTPTHNFAGTDSGMNHLIRPALYESYHHIINASALDESEKKPYIITGNICESGDIIGKDRELNIKSGDILAILDVGAYGYSMASNYNARPRPAEILIEEGKARLIRKRETYQDLIQTQLI